MTTKRNWKDLNKKYINEGELYLDFDFLRKWDKEIRQMNKYKEGSPYKFPDGLFQFCSVIRVVFGIKFRQQQGFLMSLSKYMKIPKIPYYTQIHRRINTLGISLVDSLAEPIDGQIIAIDSTGIKLYNSGQWIREKHKKKKPFLKLHISVNTQLKQAVALEITEDSVGDNKIALKLVDKSRKIAKVNKSLMDGAYDTFKIWKGLNARGIKPVIRLRKNAKISKKSPVRSQTIKCYKENEQAWKEANQYGQRWQVESWFSSFKRRFGEYCMSTKKENILRELYLKAALCNFLIN